MMNSLTAGGQSREQSEERRRRLSGRGVVSFAMDCDRCGPLPRQRGGTVDRRRVARLRSADLTGMIEGDEHAGAAGGAMIRRQDSRTDLPCVSSRQGGCRPANCLASRPVPSRRKAGENMILRDARASAAKATGEPVVTPTGLRPRNRGSERGPDDPQTAAFSRFGKMWGDCGNVSSPPASGREPCRDHEWLTTSYRRLSWPLGLARTGDRRPPDERHCRALGKGDGRSAA